jgi:long-chain acyl-CoA synthetase
MIRSFSISPVLLHLYPFKTILHKTNLEKLLMAAHGDFKTIPEMYEYLSKKYLNIPDKYVMKSKIEDEWVGINYSQFKEHTDNFAFGLAALGVHRSAKVAIVAENRPEWVFSDMAILSLGAVDVPMYPSLTAESVQFILNNSESIGVIVSNKFQLNKILKVRENCYHLKFIIVMNEKDMIKDYASLYTFKDIQEMGIIFKQNHPNYLTESIEKINKHDLCTIIYTSGTTGEPKGVMLTHNNILSNVKSAHEVLPITDKDTFLSYLPLCHIFERMAGYYTAFSCGGTVCYAESIEAVAKNLIEVKPTIMTSVPRLFERIYGKIIKNVESQPASKQKIFHWAINVGKKSAQNKKEGKSSIILSLQYKIADKLVFQKLREKTGNNLRYFISGGAALAKDLGEFFEAIGIIILEGYGLTESSPVIAVNRPESYKFGTVGPQFGGVEVKIASDGEILAKGPNIMPGYYKNKKETDAVIKDGWLHTGDIGKFDEDGNLMITDRKKHLFKMSSGKYIAPTHIESIYQSSKYIDQFVLIGDRRVFLSALIVPDFESLKEYADSQKIAYSSDEELVNKKEIYELIEKDLSKFQKKLANYEKVRKFTLLGKPFTLETGEITPSLKVKRKFVEEKFSSSIEKMYEDYNR